jgi:hypothetical protein
MKKKYISGKFLMPRLLQSKRWTIKTSMKNRSLLGAYFSTQVFSFGLIVNAVSCAEAVMWMTPSNITAGELCND